MASPAVSGAGVADRAWVATAVFGHGPFILDPARVMSAVLADKLDAADTSISNVHALYRLGPWCFIAAEQLLHHTPPHSQPRGRRYR